MHRLHLDLVARPLRVLPALAHRKHQLTVLVRAIPGLRCVERLPPAGDQPARRILEVATELVSYVAVQSSGDPALQRVVPLNELLFEPVFDPDVDGVADAGHGSDAPV